MADEITAAINRIVSFLPRFESGELANALDAFLNTGCDLPVVDELSMCVSSSGFILIFDWIAWKNGLGLDPFDPSHVSSADVETIRRLLTVAVREDRFSGGSLAKRCSNGSIERVIRRLAEITTG